MLIKIDYYFHFSSNFAIYYLQEKAKAEPKKPEQPEVTVLNTLRILSAMETLLGQEQGYKTNILLAQAKSLEAKHGSQAASSQLLQRYVVRETLFFVNSLLYLFKLLLEGKRK